MCPARTANAQQIQQSCRPRTRMHLQLSNRLLLDSVELFVASFPHFHQVLLPARRSSLSIEELCDVRTIKTDRAAAALALPLARARCAPRATPARHAALDCHRW